MSRAMRQRFIKEVRRHHLWGADDRLLVAVSGGLDSMVLLDLLLATQGLLGGQLAVCSVDHGIRGDDGKEDLAFVAAICEQYGVPFHPVTLDNDDADEATLRAKRYAVLKGVARGDRILTAHHADDQLETVLINLLRGSGPRGLAGIPRQRENIVRPLLDFSRTELVEWAQMRDLAWREDETNQSHKYLRNKIRHSIIPLLKAEQSGITNGITRMTDQLREDEVALQQILQQVDPWNEETRSWPTSWLVQSPGALARRSLLQHIPSVENRHVQAILSAVQQGKGEIELGDGKRVLIEPLKTSLKSE
jgi:tRNA(Ile)-lysidine synthetase-like protein